MEIIKNAALMLCLFFGGIGLCSFLLAGIALKFTIIDEDYTKKLIIGSLLIAITSGIIALLTYFML